MARRRRHRALPAAALGALCAATLLGAPASGAERDREREPTRVGVRGYEWNLLLSRTRVAPGPSIIEFQNTGEDPHDLKLQKTTGGPVLATDVLEPDERERLMPRWLKRGASYRLWCALPNHADWGMEATLRVKKRR